MFSCSIHLRFQGLEMPSTANAMSTMFVARIEPQPSGINHVPPTLASSNTTMPNWNHLNRESRKMPSLTREIIQAAIDGFEAQKQRLDAQIAELRAMLTGSQAPSAKEPKAGKARRKMSPETLRRMREGQQRRWAQVKGELPEAEAKTAKPKRKLSAAGRVAIVAALKKRWAAKKAGETPAKKAKKTA
jgi:hypothetical protein